MNAVSDIPAVSGPQMLTVPQVTKLLGLSTSTVYSLIDSGALPSYPLGPNGGAIRISTTDLYAFLESRRRGGHTEAPPATRPHVLQRLRPRTKGARRKAKAGA